MAPAKIKTGDNIWLRTGKGAADPFEPATVTNVQQAGARVTVKRPGGAEEALDTAKADVFPANAAGSTASDHCALIHLNEPCILENSKIRYADDKIYTYTGKILVALNPFKALPTVYGEQFMGNYQDKDVGAAKVGGREREAGVWASVVERDARGTLRDKAAL